MAEIVVQRSRRTYFRIVAQESCLIPFDVSIKTYFRTFYLRITSGLEHRRTPLFTAHYNWSEDTVRWSDSAAPRWIISVELDTRRLEKSHIFAFFHGRRCWVLLLREYAIARLRCNKLSAHSRKKNIRDCRETSRIQGQLNKPSTVYVHIIFIYKL